MPTRSPRILEEAATGRRNEYEAPPHQAGAAPLLAAFSILATAAPVAAQEAAGNWVGPLEIEPGTQVPLVVHIKRDDAGALTGTLDSPLQGKQGLPLAGINAEAGRLAFTVPGIGGTFQGQWDADAKSWKGGWSQAGMHRSLSFQVPPRPPSADWQLPSDAEIAKLIADRNASRPGQGMVIGVLVPDGRRFVAGGTGAGAKVDRSTLFEIGSISKVFTALILADMVNRGEVSLDDPAAKYLPAGHHMPQRGGRQITLRDLSTHRSGLAPNGRRHGAGRQPGRPVCRLYRSQAAGLPRSLPADPRHRLAMAI